MNYIQWCEKVLLTFENLSQQNTYIRNHGTDEDRLLANVLGEKHEEIRQASGHGNFYEVIDDAVYDLEKLGLIEDGVNGFKKLTTFGREMALDLFTLWEKICESSSSLPARHRLALETINRLSDSETEDYAIAKTIRDHEIFSELRKLDPSFETFTDEDLWAILADLRARRLMFAEEGEYIDEVRANYRGLVWERKGQEVVNIKAINKLVRYGESSGIEFKRELRLDTKDQIAEFIRDILGLTNTHTIGERKMIIGFDDKTKEFHSSLDKSINQNKIEDVLSHYTKPVVEIHFEALAYGNRGNIGILTVKRDARLVPYKPAKSFGDKKRIKEGQVFVRRNSHVHQAEQWEIGILEAEALSAKNLSADAKDNEN
jgi:hypothetical protein